MGPKLRPVFLMAILAILSAVDAAGQQKPDEAALQKAAAPRPLAFTKPGVGTPYQVRYVNLGPWESWIIIINTGANGARAEWAGVRPACWEPLREPVRILTG